MIDKTTRSLAGLLIPAFLLGGCCSPPERGIVALEPCAPPPGAPETQAAADLRADCQAISDNTRQPEIIALGPTGFGRRLVGPRPQAV